MAGLWKLLSPTNKNQGMLIDVDVDEWLRLLAVAL